MFEWGDFFKTSQQFWSDILSDPQKLADMQKNYWENAAQFFQDASQTQPYDKRFQGEIWEKNPFFQNLKAWYLFNAEQLKNIVAQSTEDKKLKRKNQFILEQWLNAVSPANFILTNPEVLKESLESGGENLQKGFENFLKDLKKSEKNQKPFSISMTDLNAFEVGKNLAVTPGKVIYQNDLMQLIQYLPSTEKVHEIPLLIIPPWINKYYILDLQAHNSYVKWIVDQGYTVYMISWVNPNEKHKNKEFSDYIQEGVLSALDAIGEKEVNAVGFCIGGTLLACTLAYLAQKKQTRIKSATYLATLLDFENPGDIEVFIDEAQISALEKVMSKTGYLDGGHMSATFNLLRSNDLIWSYYVNHYLKGKTPVPFDILYWNSDSTNMPYKMHSQYLREMYLNNQLCQPGGMTLCDVKIDLSQIKIPTYCIATQQDHIAPWQSVFAGMQLLKGNLRFVLGESGHIVGIVNPPPAKKYGYRLSEAKTDNPETWLAESEHHQDTWWNDWIKWLAVQSGAQIKAREINPKSILEDAPGSYVKVRLG